MITFETDEERMEHPQASLIPESLWRDNEFFGNSLDANVLPLMKASKEEVLPLLKANLDSLKYKSKATWLAIALSHLDLQPLVLTDIAKRLEIEQLDLFNLILLCKNPKWVEAFIEWELSPSLEEDIFSIYYWAAERGYSLILAYLELKAPEKILAMIQAESFYAYRYAAQNGYSEVLEHLEAIAPDQILNMIHANAFYAYRYAAQNGHINVLKHLEAIAPGQILNMIQANDFYAYRFAVGNGYLAMANRMLTQSSACFAYAERHEGEYTFLVNPFIQESLTQLHQAALRISHNEEFDIAEEEQARICFYILRALIRTNNRISDDDLRFLLCIPAVRALAHQEVTEGKPNELLMVALESSNEAAASLLLILPEVRRLAEQNNYYRDESPGRLNLAQLARDPESSLTALTHGKSTGVSGVSLFIQPQKSAQGQFTGESPSIKRKFG